MWLIICRNPQEWHQAALKTKIMKKPETTYHSERLKDPRKAKEQYYDFLSGNQLPSPMLVIVKHDGNQIAFNYHFLSKSMSYDPSEGIKLNFIDSDSEAKIHIEGRNLEELWKQLTSHRVTSISEAGPSGDPDVPEEALCVEKITIG